MPSPSQSNTSDKHTIEKELKPGHVRVQLLGGQKRQILQSQLDALDALRGSDLQAVTANIKRFVDILQFKWGFEVTTFATMIHEIVENAEESTELLKVLHKKCWEASYAYLTKRGLQKKTKFVREKELWDVFEPIAAELKVILDTLEPQLTNPTLGPHTLPYTFAIEDNRQEILENIVRVQDLAYQRPPDKFKYLNKWGDDLQNVRHQIKTNIETAESLIGSNFEGSSTWQEIINIINTCMDTLVALKNMCFSESQEYMKKQGIEADSVNRRVQIGNCFNDIRLDMSQFKDWVAEKMEAGAPFVQLHFMEYRRQKLIDLIRSIATL